MTRSYSSSGEKVGMPTEFCRRALTRQPTTSRQRTSVKANWLAGMFQLPLRSMGFGALWNIL